MTQIPPRSFRFSIDRGGTFTDVYAEVPGKPGFRIVKLLSDDPDNYPDAPREGIRRIIEEVSGVPITDESIDSSSIDWIRMGTTVATNALLERKGSRCALLITRGFRDLLRIGYQNRPRIFDLEIEKPALLYEKVVEIDERIVPVKDDGTPGARIVQTSSGENFEIRRAPNLEIIGKDLLRLKTEGIESVAVVCMHSYAFPDHERMIGAIAESIGFKHVSLSSQTMPMVKIVARGDTCVVDSYLTPHIRHYIDSFRQGFSSELNPKSLMFMQSDGGLVSAEHFSGSKAILSGPAGGVVGYAMTSWSETENKPVIGFDMGGTSTDVSRFGGEYDLVHETETAGIRIQAPQLDIITVAAGGGSRLFFRNGMLAVGPESAGAHPGPVCYRKGGSLSITDANLVLGRLVPEHFPKIFGKTGTQPLDIDASRARFAELCLEVNQHRLQQGLPEISPEELALGFIRVANEVMVRPIREISVARGYDAKDHILACFGGAGGQHACAIARSLGIRKILIHRFAGILSAYGMGLADVIEDIQHPACVSLSAKTLPALKEGLSSLEAEARRKLYRQGFPDERIRTTPYLSLRYEGTDTSIMIPQPADNDFASCLALHYQREFGHTMPGRNIRVDAIRIRAVGCAASLSAPSLAARECPAMPCCTTRCFFEDGWHTIPIYSWNDFGADERISGPAIIVHETSTIVLEPHSSALITKTGTIEITLADIAETRCSMECEPAQLAIFSHLFMSIAEQMGRTLQKTAISTNIKERLDFSCAVFDATGGLVANAPHQPVHLGAMGEAVRQQIALQKTPLEDGDVLVTNHPSTGGSHLPDITVITPVIHDGRPVFFVANRGHHADIGGITPGSMPPFSKTLAEEGACIESLKLVSKGVFQEEAVTRLLASPGRVSGAKKERQIPGSRAIADNIADLKAQVAANRKGIMLIAEMIARYTLPVVQAYMKHIQVNAETAVRTLLKGIAARHAGKILKAADCLDDGSIIALAVSIDPKTGSARFDFTGTGCQVLANTNAPRAVTYSTILYALRCLIKEEIPLNQGCLQPVTIVIPPGSLLAPHEEAAVVGGNVLTSQRIVDVIFRAFGAAAASQGCMNNFTFGSERFAYYETIGGGAGAGPGWHGQSAVHTHMTNTRITDPEILEKRYPVLLNEFSIRVGSGGEGLFKGGDGLIREIEFRSGLEAAILSERRVFRPYGLEGGKEGAAGVNLLIKADGQVINLGGKNVINVCRGDRFRIHTPGGGGYGEKPCGKAAQPAR